MALRCFVRLKRWLGVSKWAFAREVLPKFSFLMWIWQCAAPHNGGLFIRPCPTVRLSVCFSYQVDQWQFICNARNIWHLQCKVSVKFMHPFKMLISVLHISICIAVTHWWRDIVFNFLICQSVQAYASLALCPSIRLVVYPLIRLAVWPSICLAVWPFPKAHFRKPVSVAVVNDSMMCCM